MDLFFILDSVSKQNKKINYNKREWRLGDGRDLFWKTGIQELINSYYINALIHIPMLIIKYYLKVHKVQMYAGAIRRKCWAIIGKPAI